MGDTARESGHADRLRLLFICIENSCRSQMAEAFARWHGGARLEAHSAGSRPSGLVDPTALRVMAEVGHDLGSHRSKGVEELPSVVYDAVISMGCGDECPSVPASRRDEWDIPDPKEMPLDEFRRARDAIEARVLDLLAELGVQAGTP